MLAAQPNEGNESEVWVNTVFATISDSGRIFLIFLKEKLGCWAHTGIPVRVDGTILNWS